MTLNAFAFFTGLFGSLHCVAMCGPLLMALPFSSPSVWMALFQRILYQLGRIIVYFVFGLFFGWVGQTFNILGWQQTVSIITGCILIILAISHFTNSQHNTIGKLQLKLIKPLSAGMGKLLIKPYGGFFAGMLNGFLPCGMVYLALAGAVNLNSIIQGGEFMFFFGLGTCPLMLATAMAGMYLRRWTRTYFSRLLPYLTLCLGIWFILRGSALDIPFLSPIMGKDGVAVCK